MFGKISLHRFMYEPMREANEAGHDSISPLELRLGIVGSNATPALAERVGWFAADNTESQVLEILENEHDVSWSKATLRKVTAEIGEGLAAHQHDAQKQQLLEWMHEADESSGRNRPLLAVGRDGIMIPIRGKTTYKEASTGTVSVFNRRGKRLGTSNSRWVKKQPKPPKPRGKRQ